MRTSIKVSLVLLGILLITWSPARSGPYGPAYVPGKSNEDRWQFVQQNLLRLCTEDKSTVESILGEGMPINAADQSTTVYRYRIANADPYAFMRTSYELEISYHGNEVASVRIWHSRGAMRALAL